MKPNGWFDWQCEDIVEGGCHTFLGNIYIGEGMFGVYLASRLAGRDKSAEPALAATRIWTVDHAWRDLFDRPSKPEGYVYRADGNGMLAVAILGWLGIRHMAEIGKPLHWQVTPKR